MIKINSQQTNQYYSNNVTQDFLEQMEKGQHQAVLDYLRAGGSLNDTPFDHGSLFFYCLSYFTPLQIKEILSTLPDGTEIPFDAFYGLMIDDQKGTQIDKVRELLPELERFNYSFEECYKAVITEGRLPWIEFFLNQPLPNLDLNVPVVAEHRITIHPFTAMNFLATKLSIQSLFPFGSNSKKKEEIQSAHNFVLKIIREMEVHPTVDSNGAKKEMERLRNNWYFEGDLQWEKDCNFFSQAATKEGLEKQITTGWDLYSSIGPFSICLVIDSNVTWLECLSYIYGYSEAELVDLMEKYK